jgi:hypothetical protein
MEHLPDDILLDFFHRQTDIFSILALASVNKGMRKLLKDSCLIQYIKLPQDQARLSTSSENTDVVHGLVTGCKKHLCVFCSRCGMITRVHLSAIQVRHQCKPNFSIVQFTNKYNLIYGYSACHLAQPDACGPDMFHAYNIPIPDIFPYTKERIKGTA